jgi:DNA-binding GntR family transcriptional regulator
LIGFGGLRECNGPRTVRPLKLAQIGDQLIVKEKTSVDSKTLLDEAYAKIKQMIFQQKVSPGQRLIYQDLCDLLNMSRTPIIHALTRLERDGFLISRPNRGFSVKPISLHEAEDLFGVREALEVYAVEQAIGRFSGSGTDAAASIKRLQKRAFDHQAYCPGSYDRRKFFLDAEFHLEIAAVAGNLVLERLLRTNLEHVYLRYNLHNYDPGRMVKAVEEHARIIANMRAADVVGAGEILRRHIRAARDAVLTTLARQEEVAALM